MVSWLFCPREPQPLHESLDGILRDIRKQRHEDPSFPSSSSSVSSWSSSVSTHTSSRSAGGEGGCTTAPFGTHSQSAAPKARVPCQHRHGRTAHTAPCIAIAHAIFSCAHTHASFNPLQALYGFPDALPNTVVPRKTAAKSSN
jgi:hypothetical protein